MMTGLDASPGFHQPLNGMPSLVLNSASLTARPTESGVFGPRSGKRNLLFVIRKEAPTGSTTKSITTMKHAIAIINRILHRFRVARFIPVLRRNWRECFGHLHLEVHRLF